MGPRNSIPGKTVCERVNNLNNRLLQLIEHLRMGLERARRPKRGEARRVWNEGDIRWDSEGGLYSQTSRLLCIFLPPKIGLLIYTVGPFLLVLLYLYLVLSRRKLRTKIEAWNIAAVIRKHHVRYFLSATKKVEGRPHE